MSLIDMHVHSHCSLDADYHPEILLEMAKKKGIQVFSIADHNTAAAYSQFDWKKETKIRIIPAIELDCTIDEVNLHVLGYGINPEAVIFRKIHQDILKQEETAGIKRVELVRKLGIHIDENRIREISHGEISGEIICEAALMDKQNENCELLMPYRPKGSRSDNPYVNFYWDYCAQGKAAYVAVRYITLNEAVEAICSAGGIAVIAHPGNNIHEDEILLNKIMNSGVEGIEVYSSYHSKQQVQFYLKKAEEYGCLITCGSDFHGKNKPSIEIGHCEVQDEKQLIERINQRINDKVK